MRRLTPRKHERKRIIGQAAVRTLPDGQPLSALVLDLGQSGVSLSMDRGLTPGLPVEISFQVRSEAQARGLGNCDGYIVRSRAHLDCNILGVAFTRPLSDEDFLALQEDWVRS